MDALTDVFLRFGRVECAGVSPLYARLSEVVAADPSLLALAACSRAAQPPPNLLFGAVHLLLMREPGVPLADWYADLAHARVRHDDPGSAFRTFCSEHHAELAALLRERRVQTNEVRRCLALLPALEVVSREAGRPLALIEVGPSAGLLLHLERYAYTYQMASARVELGDPGSSVQLAIEVRGPGTPPLGTRPPAIGWRLGLDLHPLDPASSEDREWLLALVWPEHDERRRQLSAAFALAAAAPRVVEQGDAPRDLGRALARAPAGAALVVFHMSVLRQIPVEGLAALEATVLEASRSRPVYRISNDLWPQDEARLPLVLSRYVNGQRHDELLAEIGHGHVPWLRWVGTAQRAAGLR